MTTSRESSRQQASVNETRSTKRDERVFSAGRVIARRALLATTLIGVGVAIGLSTSGEDTPVNASATNNVEQLEAMDAMVSRELAKGPQDNDLIVNDGLTFTIGPSGTVGEAMTRVDRRANPSGPSILQTKATTASAENFKPNNAYVFPEDRIVMWQDTELTAVDGQSVLLAMPADRLEH